MSVSDLMSKCLKEYFVSRGVVLFLTKHLNMTFPIVKMSVEAAWESLKHSVYVLDDQVLSN